MLIAARFFIGGVVFLIAHKEMENEYNHNYRR